MNGLLISGGLDSAAMAWWKKPELCFFVNYGQKPAIGERNASKIISDSIDAKFIEINIDCKSLGSGTLAGKLSLSESPSEEWWPFRNQLLATLVGAKALELGVKKLLFGAVKTDHFHRDGSPDFFLQLNNLFNMQEGEITVEAPGVKTSCEDLIILSKIPYDLLLLTHSCHKNNFACGTCGGCVKHYAVLRMLGIKY